MTCGSKVHDLVAEGERSGAHRNRSGSAAAGEGNELRAVARIVGNRERTGARPRNRRSEVHVDRTISARAHRLLAGVGLAKVATGGNSSDVQRDRLVIGQGHDQWRALYFYLLTSKVQADTRKQNRSASACAHGRKLRHLGVPERLRGSVRRQIFSCYPNGA